MGTPEKVVCELCGDPIEAAATRWRRADYSLRPGNPSLRESHLVCRNLRNWVTRTDGCALIVFSEIWPGHEYRASVMKLARGLRLLVGGPVTED